MDSPVVKATLQAIVMSATSNLLAQALDAWNSETPFELQMKPLMNFIVLAIICTPPNFYWQQYLEEAFPAHTIVPAVVVDKSGGKSNATGHTEVVPTTKLNKRNTAIKFFMDQTIGASLNTIAFLAAMAAMNGSTYEGTLDIVKRETLPLMFAGYKLWPMVSLLSFTIIPVEYRLLFGGLVGMGWGIFVSLFTNKALNK